MKLVTVKSGFGTYECLVEKGQSIAVARYNREGKIEGGTRFRIGDQAEYDSYNLSYLGEIVAITEKTVTIRPKYETKTRRLSLDTFAWRNWDFNLEETMKQNAETSMYI